MKQTKPQLVEVNQLLDDDTGNRIYRTSDYEKFSSLEGNREVNLPHLKRLKKSIAELDLTESSPILINEKFEIIDGQHRFEVCKYLKKPIYYLIKRGYGLKEIQILNGDSRNWKVEDYIKGYCELGKEEFSI